MSASEEDPNEIRRRASQLLARFEPDAEEEEEESSSHDDDDDDDSGSYDEEETEESGGGGDDRQRAFALLKRIGGPRDGDDLANWPSTPMAKPKADLEAQSDDDDDDAFNDEYDQDEDLGALVASVRELSSSLEVESSRRQLQEQSSSTRSDRNWLVCSILFGVIIIVYWIWYVVTATGRDRFDIPDESGFG